MAQREKLSLAGAAGGPVPAEKLPPVSPMDAKQLVATAKALEGRPAEVHTVYGSVDHGTCLGAGSLAVGPDGAPAGSLVLSGEVPDEASWRIHFPAAVVARLVEVRPELTVVDA